MARTANPLGPWEYRTRAAEYRSEPIDPSDTLSWRRFGCSRYPTRVVYRLFDASGELLYVGMSWNPSWRWVYHRRTKDWWPEVAHAEVILYPDELAARKAETACIKSESPRYNIHQAAR